MRETSRNSARCDRTRVRAVRVLGSRGSGHLGRKSMTPRPEDTAAEHGGGDRRLRVLVVTAALVVVTVTATAHAALAGIRNT